MMIFKEVNKNMSVPLLEIENVEKVYIQKKLYGTKILHAVSNVTLELKRGETLGLVGESGSGKSTLGQLIGQLLEPSDGKLKFNGKAISEMDHKEKKMIKKDVQYVFQDAHSALNPRHTVEKLIEEPLIIQKIGTSSERKKWVYEMIYDIGLDESYKDAYIHELSGGQKQRVGIARALILKPKLLVLDEPVSALDVSVQAQILNLLKSLQQKYSLTYLFISHNLDVVHYMSDRIAVMYLGKIVELGIANEIYHNPYHPYTKALVSAIPSLERKSDPIFLEGEIPSATNVPTGCVLHTRCPFAGESCKIKEPPLVDLNKEHKVACHLFS